MPKITLGNTGLQEILGRNYGIEEPLLGTLVVVVQKTEEKCTKKRARARVKLLFAYYKTGFFFLTFSLPSRRRILSP